MAGYVLGTLVGGGADTGEFPVFAPDGTLLGNLTSSQGQQPLPGATILGAGGNTTPYAGPNLGPLQRGTTTTTPQPTTSSIGSFFQGLLPQPGASGSIAGPGGNITLGGFDVEPILVFLLGLVFIGGGLYLFAKK